MLARLGSSSGYDIKQLQKSPITTVIMEYSLNTLIARIVRARAKLKASLVLELSIKIKSGARHPNRHVYGKDVYDSFIISLDIEWG